MPFQNYDATRVFPQPARECPNLLVLSFFANSAVALLASFAVQDLTVGRSNPFLTARFAKKGGKERKDC